MEKSIILLLQVHWQETLRGLVAGVLTTQRVLMVSADLDILASSYAKFDKGMPSISLTLVDKLFSVYLLGYKTKLYIWWSIKFFCFGKYQTCFWQAVDFKTKLEV